MASSWNSLIRWTTGKTQKDSQALDRHAVSSAINDYNSMFKEDTHEQGRCQAKIQERTINYLSLVNHYYDLVTDFYEYGWGQCFHFAPRFTGENFDASLARHEYYLAHRMELGVGMKVLDVGSGIGGPMRNISRFSQATIVGVNNNDYQIKRCAILNERCKLSHRCSSMKADFMCLPFSDNEFDAAYQIEATCHSPDKTGCFRQIFKVLKPGSFFAGYEWCMTDKYDENNVEHNLIKHGVEAGDGLPDLPRTYVVDNALIEAGFELVDAFDVAEKAQCNGNAIPWQNSLKGAMNLAQFKRSSLGRFCTQTAVDILETLHLAPKGTSDTSKMLNSAADSLVQAGDMGIFTPMYFFMARKPLEG